MSNDNNLYMPVLCFFLGRRFRTTFFGTFFSFTTFHPLSCDVYVQQYHACIIFQRHIIRLSSLLLSSLIAVQEAAQGQCKYAWIDAVS
jgi:hypothetical protein